MKIPKSVIVLTLLIVVALVSFIFLNYQEEDKSKINEKINQDVLNDDDTLQNNDVFQLTNENRLDLIIFLLENAAFSAFTYNSIEDVTPGFIAIYFIDWDNNPTLSETQKNLLADNYDTSDWYQMGDYGEIEKYIPFQLIDKYYQKVTGASTPEPKTENCLIFIPEIEGYIAVCGHGMWNGNVDRLTFSGDGEFETLFYVEEVTHKENDNYVFKVRQYHTESFEENLAEKITKFITGEAIADEVSLNIGDYVYYLMRKDNENWQFVVFSNEPL